MQNREGSIRIGQYHTKNYWMSPTCESESSDSLNNNYGYQILL